MPHTLPFWPLHYSPKWAGDARKRKYPPSLGVFAVRYTIFVKWVVRPRLPDPARGAGRCGLPPEDDFTFLLVLQ